MPKASPIQTSLNTGEISPLMRGRVDFDKYKSALATCLNHIPLVQGPVVRRPGTTYVASGKNAADTVRLVKFEFSTTQAYILEFGDKYIRIYRNHGQVTSGGSPVEVTTTYAKADLFQLMFTQSADVLYIAHASYKPQTLSRTSDTSWTLSDYTFNDGPYLDVNTTSTTLAVGATTTGSTTLTASAVTGINGGAGFQSGDVGRLVRLQVSGQAWAWGRITAVASTTSATIDMQSAAGSTTATATWRFGVWSDESGWPAALTFYQNRLVFGGSTATPETVYGSVTGDYSNFSPTALDTAGTVTDSNGYDFTLNSTDVQIIRWLSGDANGLLVGTVSGEWALAPSTLGGALTPTNVNAVQMTAYGNAQVQAVRVGYTTLMLQRSLRKLRELTFVYYENRYHAPDMTVLAQHITLGGITQMAYQQEPNSILWCVRSDGVLLGFTYERDQNVVGWHRHVIGGVSDANGSDAIVESVATIPAPDGSRDEVWLSVKRYVNGAAVRHIEYMNKIWEKGDTLATSAHLDAAISYSGSATKNFSGADYLKGETVSVMADGAVLPDVTVASDGTFSISVAASDVTVGYSYNSDGETLRSDAGAGDGTAQGKTQRTHRATFRVQDTLGLKVGRDFDNLVKPDAIGRTTADALGKAVALFDGDVGFQWEGDYTEDNVVCWRFSGPLPGMVQAIMPQLHTMDR